MAQNGQAMTTRKCFRGGCPLEIPINYADIDVTSACGSQSEGGRSTRPFLQLMSCLPNACTEDR